jgi:osmotically-inducible protein OsmY
MQDPDKDYLITEREGRDRDRYAFIDSDSSGMNFRDLTLKEEVGEALAFHEDIDASQVEVDVRGGVVTLLGSVQSEREKLEAADRASDVDGVITVINQIGVHS